MHLQFLLDHHETHIHLSTINLRQGNHHHVFRLILRLPSPFVLFTSGLERANKITTSIHPKFINIIISFPQDRFPGFASREFTFTLFVDSLP
jgi:hypothetical protein